MADFVIELRALELRFAAEGKAPSGSQKTFARIVVNRKDFSDSTQPAEVRRTGGEKSVAAEWRMADMYVNGSFANEGGVFSDKKIKEKPATIRLHWTRDDTAPDAWTRRAVKPDRGWTSTDEIAIDLSDALRCLGGGGKDKVLTSVDDAKSTLKKLSDADVPVHKCEHKVTLDKQKYVLQFEMRVCREEAAAKKGTAEALTKAIAEVEDEGVKKLFPDASAFYRDQLDRLKTLVDASPHGVPALVAPMNTQIVTATALLKSRDAARGRGENFGTACRTAHDWSERLAERLRHDGGDGGSPSSSPKRIPPKLAAAMMATPYDTESACAGAVDLDKQDEEAKKQPEPAAAAAAAAPEPPAAEETAGRREIFDAEGVAWVNLASEGCYHEAKAFIEGAFKTASADMNRAHDKFRAEASEIRKKEDEEARRRREEKDREAAAAAAPALTPAAEEPAVAAEEEPTVAAAPIVAAEEKEEAAPAEPQEEEEQAAAAPAPAVAADEDPFAVIRANARWDEMAAEEKVFWALRALHTKRHGTVPHFSGDLADPANKTPSTAAASSPLTAGFDSGYTALPVDLKSGDDDESSTKFEDIVSAWNAIANTQPKKEEEPTAAAAADGEEGAAAAAEESNEQEAPEEEESKPAAPRTGVKLLVQSGIGSGKSTSAKWLGHHAEQLRGVPPPPEHPHHSFFSFFGKHDDGASEEDKKAKPLLQCAIHVDLPQLVRGALTAVDNSVSVENLKVSQPASEDPDWLSLIFESFAAATPAAAGTSAAELGNDDAPAAPDAVIPPEIIELTEVTRVLREHSAHVLYVFDGFDEVSTAVNRSPSLGLLLNRLHDTEGTLFRNVVIFSRPDRRHVLSTSSGPGSARRSRGLTMRKATDAKGGADADSDSITLFAAEHGWSRASLLPWSQASAKAYVGRFPWPGATTGNKFSPERAAIALLERDGFDWFGGSPLLAHLACCVVHPTAAWRYAKRHQLGDRKALASLQDMTPVTAIGRVIDCLLEWSARRKLLKRATLVGDADALEEAMVAENPELLGRHGEMLTRLQRRSYDTTVKGNGILVSLTVKQVSDLEGTSLFVCIEPPSNGNNNIGRYRMLHRALTEYLCAVHLVEKVAVDADDVAQHFNTTVTRDSTPGTAVACGISLVDRPRLGDAGVLSFVAEILSLQPENDARRVNVVRAVRSAMDAHLHPADNAPGKWPTLDALARSSGATWQLVQEASHLVPYIQFQHALGRSGRKSAGDVSDPAMNDMLKDLVRASVRRAPTASMKRSMLGADGWFVLTIMTAGAAAGSLQALRFASVRGAAMPEVVDRVGAIGIGRRSDVVLNYAKKELGFKPSVEALLQYGTPQGIASAVNRGAVRMTAASCRSAVDGLKSGRVPRANVEVLASDDTLIADANLRQPIVDALAA